MLLLARHAPTQYNDEAHPRLRGWIDLPLDSLGLRLAAATARYIASRMTPAIVITSDLTRAIQTGRTIASATGAPLHADRRLRPWDIGALTGQEATAKNRAQMHLFQFDVPDTPIPGGEAYNTFLGRWGEALNELLARAQAQDVVAVAHHRNALALPQLLRGEPSSPTGPPEPAGVLEVTPTDFREVFVPPNHHRGTGTGS